MYVYIYIYICVCNVYLYICVCVCVCVCPEFEHMITYEWSGHLLAIIFLLGAENNSQNDSDHSYTGGT